MMIGQGLETDALKDVSNSEETKSILETMQ